MKSDATAASGQQVERFHMRWTNDREVPMVERRDLLDLQALGKRDDRRVHRAERQIPVRRTELCDPCPVKGLDRQRFVGALQQVSDEPELNERSRITLQEVCHLRNDEYRDEQRTAVTLKQASTVFVTRVA